MNLITWLLFGHLIGDWLLQNDWMASGKKQGWFTRAGMTHFAIYTLSVMTFMGVALQNRGYPISYFVVSGVVIFVSHWLVDASNVVSWWNRAFRQTDNVLMRIMIDQILHITVLVVLAAIFDAL
jgi:hypothetical protein